VLYNYYQFSSSFSLPKLIAIRTLDAVCAVSGFRGPTQDPDQLQFAFQQSQDTAWVKIVDIFNSCHEETPGERNPPSTYHAAVVVPADIVDSAILVVFLYPSKPKDTKTSLLSMRLYPRPAAA
jgi:hypothetical protein